MDLEAFDALDIYDQRAALDRLAGQRRDAMAEYRALVEHIRKKSHNKNTDVVDMYEHGVAELSVDELTHLDLVSIGRIHRQPITKADSFFRKVTERRRKKQLGPVPEKYLGIGKERDQLFAELLEVRMPTLHFVGALDDIPGRVRANALLKPTNASGSKGAYYLFGKDDIYSVQHSHKLDSWESMRAEIAEQFGEDALAEPVWQIQELIYEEGDRPARDMKFYAFYGKIGLIQEVSRHPTKQYEFFDDDCTLARCGRDHEPRFKDPADTVTDKGGLSKEKLDHVRWLSRQIPAPFIRIDFLNAPDELVFLEFSAAPGMSHTLSPEYDELLGRYYEEAEMRLVDDLLGGKEFPGWRAFTDQMPDSTRPKKPAENGPARTTTPSLRSRILSALRE